MRRPVIALCLAGGGILAAGGMAGLVFLRQPLGAVAALAGLALIAGVVWTLRGFRHGSELLWSAVFDAVLVLGMAMAVLPVVAVVRGFVELFTSTHVHSARDAIAYGLAFAGLLLGGVFFAYAV